MPRLKNLNLSRNFSDSFTVPSLNIEQLKKLIIMKKFGIIILLTAIIMTGFSLKVTAESQVVEKQGTETKVNESTKVTISNDLISVEENDKENERARRRSRFRGHWTGIEFGFNNYVTSDKSLVLPADIDYMTLHSSKSSNFNINFSQLSLGMSRHFGIVTGLGLNWNNYRFDGNNNIIKGDNGIIEKLDPETNLKKSKLATLFLTLPLMLELQIPVDHSRLNIAAGPIGAVKLGSHTKMVYENGEKIKSNGDFSLNMLRYGATARIGYANFQLYGTYYMTPMFRTGKGPGGNDLFPFEIGIALTFND
jgi:hypothetical protein